MPDASSIYYPVFGWRRWTEKTTFTSSSAAASYPASNLGTLPLSDIWESTSITGEYVKGELDKSRGVRLFLIHRHSFQNAATFRLRLYSDDAATQADLVYDSDTAATLIAGNEIWPVVYGSELEWEDDNFIDGKYTEDEKLDTVWPRPIWLDRVYECLSWRLDFTDADNTDGVFRIGMIDVCQSYQMTRGFRLGTEFGFEERTQTVTAYGGVDYHERLEKKRTIDGEIRFVDRDEAQGVFYELQRQHDLDVPLAFLMDPYDTKNWLRTCGIYKIARLTKLTREHRDFETIKVALKEAF